MPHRAVEEFWRSRQSDGVLNHHALKAREARNTLLKASKGAVDTLTRWAKDVQLERNDIEKQLFQLQKAFDGVLKLVETRAEQDTLKESGDTNKDPVLARLEPILRGRVGSPLSNDAYTAALAEAMRRGQAKEPPGFKDFDEKPESLAAGDYLVWEQTLVEAEKRKTGILFVTGDVKEDWWQLRTEFAPARPRAELVEEMLRRAGQQLFMVTPSELMRIAKDILNVTIEPGSVADLAHLEQEASTYHVLIEPGFDESLDRLSEEDGAKAVKMMAHLASLGPMARSEGNPHQGDGNVRMLTLDDLIIIFLVSEKRRRIIFLSLHVL